MTHFAQSYLIRIWSSPTPGAASPGPRPPPSFQGPGEANAGLTSTPCRLVDCESKCRAVAAADSALGCV